MKTPRRGLKTLLYKVFLKNQILHNNRFTILVLQHSCSQNSISGSKTLQFIFKYKRKMFKNFIRESVKKSLTQNYNIFCIFITIVYGGKSFSLELSNFSGHSGRARGLINDNYCSRSRLETWNWKLGRTVQKHEGQISNF